MFSPSTLSEQIAAIESALLKFKSGKAEVTLTLAIHDDIPEGFVEKMNSAGTDPYYEKIVEAKDGMVKKSITLHIPD